VSVFRLGKSQPKIRCCISGSRGASGNVEGEDWLSTWNRPLTGLGTLDSYYEGNIKTCADKGMRLPTAYETTMGNPGASQVASGDEINPIFANVSNGVPQVPGRFTWTATAYGLVHVGAGAYANYSLCGWGDRGRTCWAGYSALLVRCVLPTNPIDATPTPSTTSSTTTTTTSTTLPLPPAPIVLNAFIQTGNSLATDPTVNVFGSPYNFYGTSSTATVTFATDSVATVNLYSDSACSIQLNATPVVSASGDISTGSLTANSLTHIYLQASNAGGSSNCTDGDVGTYTYDPTAPSISDFLITPSADFNSAATIAVTPSETALIEFFSDSNCNVNVGTSNFPLDSSSHSILTSNFCFRASCDIWGKLTDNALNKSTCTPLGTYTNLDYVPLCGDTGNGCYDNSSATTAGVARLSDGTQIDYVDTNNGTGFKVWKEHLGSRILFATGLWSSQSDWQKQLNRTGIGAKADDFTDISKLGGKACPTNTFINYDNMVVSNLCLYYDTGSTTQALNADSGIEGEDFIMDGDRPTSGRGTASSWYEGNIQTCASRGMRLPTAYETDAEDQNNFTTQMDATPVFGNNGVPSYAAPGGPYWRFSWTASVNPNRTDYYFRWSTYSQYYYSNTYTSPSDSTIRCVLPSGHRDSSSSPDTTTSTLPSTTTTTTLPVTSAGYLNAFGINSYFISHATVFEALRTAPTLVGTDSNWSSISAGFSHVLAIKDGKLYAWGINDKGQLGDGTTTDRKTPIQIGSDSTWTFVSAGTDYSLGINNGKLYAWGKNSSAVLGDGTFNDRNIPTQIGTDSTWTFVSAAANHSLGINNGKLYAWGSNTYGQLGDGTYIMKKTPTQIGTDSTWTYVSAGENHSLAINNGKLYAWGHSTHGQIGDGTSTVRGIPTQIGSDSTWMSVSAGGNHSLGINNGKLYAWGDNGDGVLGDGTTTDRNTPTQVGVDSNWTQVSTSYTHSLAIKDGSLYAWGNNFSGQLGNSSSLGATDPILIDSDNTWTQISAGTFYSLSIQGGALFSWGDNSLGLLADGAFVTQTDPTQLGADSTWSKVSAGYYHSLAIQDGKLFAWGNMSDGRLGTQYFWAEGSNFIKQVGSETTWTAVSAGGTHSLGINNRKLFAWGGNSNGQLGDGTNNSQSAPVQIGSDSNWTFVSAGSNHSLAINNGKLFAWGGNNFGQLGDGTLTDRKTPTQIGTDSNWTFVSAGEFYSLGINNGNLYAWGHNESGQLGEVTGWVNNIPLQIGSDADWTSVSAGLTHSLGIRGGKLFAWGNNWAGQLGDGTHSNKSIPTQIGSDSTWTSVSAGWFHSVGINHGVLYTWGGNSSGQLGDGTTTSKNTPTQIGTESNWTDVSAGGHFSLALKSTAYDLSHTEFNLGGLIGDCETTFITQVVNTDSVPRVVTIVGSADDDLLFDGTVYEDGQYSFWNPSGNGCGVPNATNGAHVITPYSVVLSPGQGITIEARDNGYGGAYGVTVSFQ